MLISVSTFRLLITVYEPLSFSVSLSLVSPFPLHSSSHHPTSPPLSHTLHPIFCNDFILAQLLYFQMPFLILFIFVIPLYFLSLPKAFLYPITTYPLILFAPIPFFSLLPLPSYFFLLPPNCLSFSFLPSLFLPFLFSLRPNRFFSFNDSIRIFLEAYTLILFFLHPLSFSFMHIIILSLSISYFLFTFLFFLFSIF